MIKIEYIGTCRMCNLLCIVCCILRGYLVPVRFACVNSVKFPFNLKINNKYKNKNTQFSNNILLIGYIY